MKFLKTVKSIEIFVFLLKILTWMNLHLPKKNFSGNFYHSLGVDSNKELACGKGLCSDTPFPLSEFCDLS